MMASQIDTTIPRAGNADTARMRNQFGVIKSEIEALQRACSSILESLERISDLPGNAVEIDRLAKVALSGSYYHLIHQPSIPSNAQDVGALPVSGGKMMGPIELAADAKTALGPVSLQQLNMLLSEFAKVARSGAYHDLSGKPTLGSAAATQVTDYATTAQGVKADSALQQADLAAVATTGLYKDLAGRPVLGTAASTSSSKYATAGQGSRADSAVQPEVLASVAFSGDYQALSNTPDFGTAAFTSASAYATAAQGNKADSAVQPDELALAATTGDFADLVGALTESQLDSALAAKVNKTLPYNVDAVVPPGASDDISAGWLVGSLWVDAKAGEAYRCVSNVAGAAVWANTTLESYELANVALSGNYSDLSGKPTLGSAAATSANAYATASQGTRADSAVQPADLHMVATSGKYADLSGKPTLGSAAATNSSAYASAAQGKKADSAVQPDDLHDVATSGAYGSLAGTPSALSEFSNDVGYITEGQVPASPVLSVNDKAGKVKITYDDVGAASAGHTHSPATKTTAGFLSGADKKKLDELASVASSGDYADLSGKPTLGSAAATNSSAYASATQGEKADSAVQPDDLHQVARSGSYNDLGDLPVAAAGLVMPPVNQSPLAGALGLDPALDIELQASAFAASADDQHVGGQWQVSTSPDFSTIVYDSGEVTT